VLIVLATFGVFAAVGVLLPALPGYVTGPIGGGAGAVGLVVGLFSVAALCARPLAGRLGDQRGRRLLLTVGPALVALAIGAFPFARSVHGLVGLRLIQGLGEGLFYVGAAAAVTDLAPPDRRAEAFSYFSSAQYLGLAVGPLVATALLHGEVYTEVWILAAGFAGFAALCGAAVPDAMRPPAVAGRRPLLHRGALVPGTAFGLATLGYAAFVSFMPLHAKDVGLAGSGPLFACYAGVTLLGRTLGARVPDRLGAAPTAGVGMASIAGGMVLLGVWASPAGMWLGTLVFAAGNAFMYPALLSLVVSRASELERASVVATVIAFFDVGQGLGPLVLGPVAVAVGNGGPFLVGAAGGMTAVALLAITVRQAGLRAGSAGPPPWAMGLPDGRAA
jgi:MFS family permease